MIDLSTCCKMPVRWEYEFSFCVKCGGECGILNTEDSK